MTPIAPAAAAAGELTRAPKLDSWAAIVTASLTSTFCPAVSSSIILRTISGATAPSLQSLGADVSATDGATALDRGEPPGRARVIAAPRRANPAANDSASGATDSVVGAPSIGAAQTGPTPSPADSIITIAMTAVRFIAPLRLQVRV